MFKVNQVSHLQAKLHIKKATFALWKSGSVRSCYFVYGWTQILKHDTFSQASCRGKSLTCPAGWKSLLGGAGSKGQTPAPPLKDLSGKSSRTGRCKHHCPCKGVWLCLLFSDICFPNSLVLSRKTELLWTDSRGTKILFWKLIYIQGCDGLSAQFKRKELPAFQCNSTPAKSHPSPWNCLKHKKNVFLKDDWPCFLIETLQISTTTTGNLLP